MTWCDHGENLSCLMCYQALTALDEGDPQAIALGDPFVERLTEVYRLHLEKRGDYGTRADPLANYHYAESMGHKAHTATLLRMNEKFFRMQNLYRTKAGLGQLREEVRDIAVIAVITMQLLDEEMNGEP